jgi:hypothetical protein
MLAMWGENSARLARDRVPDKMDIFFEIDILASWLRLLAN